MMWQTSLELGSFTNHHFWRRIILVGIWRKDQSLLDSMGRKKTQAHVFVWGLLMSSHKNCSALLDALNRKEVPIETTLQEVLSLMGVEAPSHPSLTFSDKELPPEGATHTRPLQITI